MPGLDRGLDGPGRRNETGFCLCPRAQKAEAQIVVPVAGRVVVPICRPAVPGVIVPAAAAFHPVRTAFIRLRLPK